MCGRFILTSAAEVVAELFDVADVPTLTPRQNICPTEAVGAVVFDAEASGRGFRGLRWGLIPSWAKDPNIGARMFNARAETVAEKPSFRSAFKARRCLVVADGFYEWKKLDRGKQPHRIGLSEGGPFAFAGLWEHWQGGDGEPIDSCTIITTEPNELLAPIHERMPVILPPEDYAVWLDPEIREASVLQPLLRSYPAEAMTAQPVDSARFRRKPG